MTGIIPMDDEELALFLGIAGHPKAAAVIADLPPEKRALYDRMAGLVLEAELYAAGLGPKPKDALIDTVRSTKRRKAWR